MPQTFITDPINIKVIRHFKLFRSTSCEPGSSVIIVYGYGLDDRAIEVRSPAEANDFSSILCVQTDSADNPAPYTMSTGCPFPEGKARPGRDADHSLPSSTEVENV
jgi:hypothetical protein